MYSPTGSSPHRESSDDDEEVEQYFEELDEDLFNDRYEDMISGLTIQRRASV